MAVERYTTQNTQVGKSISKLKTVEDLCRKVEALKTHRMPLERQWRLNLAFYKGKQYSFYPPRSNRLESLATDEGTMPRHRVRLVSNQIMPGTHTLLAQLTKTKPRIFATPSSGSENEIRAAQMAQDLLEFWWEDFHLDAKLDEALLWSIIGGAGYWKISWDNFAAKQMKFLLDPDGNPITDDALKATFVAELEKAGIPKDYFEKIVYMGDIKVDVLAPFDVFLDPSAKIFDDAKYAICIHHLDPDEIKSRWGKEVLPDSAPTSPDTSLPFQGSPNSPELSIRKVYIGYFKPTAAMPNGRHVVWIDGSDKQILEDSKWPYPYHTLPLVKFAGLRVPGSVYDDAFVTHAVPLNKELNRTLSQIVEYKNYTVNPVMRAPVGSLRVRRTTEPGQVMEYVPIGQQGLGPEFEVLPALPPYIFDHLENISARLQDIFLSAEVIQGKVPPNVEAGVAIDLLQEMATDKLAPIIKLIETSLASSGQQMLALAQKYYIEPRLLTIRGSGGAVQVKQFTNADIAGNITFRAEAGSGLPRTRAGRQARIERLIDLGVIPPYRAAKYLDLADLKGLEHHFQADEEFAYRNIDKIMKGEIINPEALQSMIQQVQSGINPETGEQLQSEQEAQALIYNAGLQPPMAIDVDTHIDITSLFMKGLEFENLEPSVRADFNTYYNSLIQTKQSMAPKPPAEAPRVSYQLRGTVGPSAAAKIIGHTGVPVSADELSEPPLETWVSDSVDKPDTDAAGPGQEANQLSDVAKIMIETKIADAEAKHAAAMKTLSHESDTADKEQGTTMKAVESAAKLRREEELHEFKLKEAAAKADLAKKKVKEPLKKPNASKD